MLSPAPISMGMRSWASTALRRGLGGFGSVFSRSYHSYNTLLLPGYMHGGDGQEWIQDSVERDFAKLSEIEFEEPDAGVLNIASSFEFSRNGRIDLHSSRVRLFNAGAPIDATQYTTLRDTIIRMIADARPNLLYSPGTVAVDTGETVDGTRIVENRGVVAQGGSSQLIEFSKMFESTEDGVEPGFRFRSGTGPVTLAIPDVFGDPAVVSVFVCLDWNMPEARATVPIEPHLILLPAFGAPGGDVLGEAELVVIDGWDEPFTDLHLRSGVQEIKESPARPFLQKLFRYAEGGGSVADAVSTMLNLTSVTPEEAYRLVKEYSSVNFERLTLTDGSILVRSGVRKLPKIDARTVEHARAMTEAMGGRASLITGLHGGHDAPGTTPVKLGPGEGPVPVPVVDALDPTGDPGGLDPNAGSGAPGETPLDPTKGQDPGTGGESGPGTGETGDPFEPGFDPPGGDPTLEPGTGTGLEPGSTGIDPNLSGGHPDGPIDW